MIDPGSNLPFAELFFPSFSIHIRMAFIFNTNEGNNQKVKKKKVSGRVRVGQGFNVPIR